MHFNGLSIALLGVVCFYPRSMMAFHTPLHLARYAKGIEHSSLVRMALTSTKAQTISESVPKEDIYEKVTMDDIVSLCKRRGIIFPSSEIYNGFAGL